MNEGKAMFWVRGGWCRLVEMGVLGGKVPFRLRKKDAPYFARLLAEKYRPSEEEVSDALSSLESSSKFRLRAEDRTALVMLLGNWDSLPDVMRAVTQT